MGLPQHEMVAALRDLVGTDLVLPGDEVSEDFSHDEALTAAWIRPDAVVRPGSTADVERVVRWANVNHVPVTARGSGTGVSGACIPRRGGILLSFESMASVLEIDVPNQVAVVQPGVTLADLDAALQPYGMIYAVTPGENGASVGGNIATNAGGMRAVRYGVTRHHVLGVEAVLGTGETIRSGGKFVKSTSGYDLTQLIIGSEGTLAVVTEATVRLHVRLPFSATVLMPLPSVEAIVELVPQVLARGLEPSILEYIDRTSMKGITRMAGVDLGLPESVRSTSEAYLVVVLEAHNATRLDEDVLDLCAVLSACDPADIYVLPSQAGADLIRAREMAFWSAKAGGVHDIVDMVVPRACIPELLGIVKELAASTRSYIVGCGHAGDGNVHLSVVQPDDRIRSDVMRRLLGAGIELGGAVSGEHGIGSEKLAYLAEFEDPAKLALWRRIKEAFDPEGILNPGAVFD